MHVQNISDYYIDLVAYVLLRYFVGLSALCAPALTLAYTLSRIIWCKLRLTVFINFVTTVLAGIFLYFIQHCFICHPPDSTVSADARIEPRTFLQSDHLDGSHPYLFFCADTKNSHF
jgi:hypothetical protein